MDLLQRPFRRPINWLNSYSEYVPDLEDWYADNVAENFIAKRKRMIAILQEEASLMEIVKLIGSDVLPDTQKATLEVARVIRLGFLQQNAFHKEDTFVPMEKQNLMIDLILQLDTRMRELTEAGGVVSAVLKTDITNDIIKVKYNIPNDDLSGFKEMSKKVDKIFDEIMSQYKTE